MHEPIRELAGVGEKEQTRAIQVESTDRNPPARWEVRENCRAALGVAACNQFSDWLVIEEDARA
jgi:hypothetical protein